MSNSDGQVRIIIDTNAESAAKELDKVSNAFDKAGNSAKKNASSFDNLGKSYNTALVAQEKLFYALNINKSFKETSTAVNDAKERLRELAFQGNITSKEFQNLKQYVLEANKKFQETDAILSKNGLSFTTSQTDNLTKAIGKLVGGLSALKIAQSSFQYIMQSIDAFRQEERSILALNTSLANAGVYSRQYSNEIQQLASEIQTYSNYSNDAVIKAQALGQSFAGNTPITKELTKAVIDFAAVTNKDLDSAFTLVGKSIGSNTNALSRYGIELNNNMSASEKATAIAIQLENAYTGQARNMADGNIQLKNSFEEVSKAIGSVFSPELQGVQNELSKFATRTAEVIRKINKLKEAWYKLNIAITQQGINTYKNNNYNKADLEQQEARLKRYQKALQDLNKTQNNIKNRVTPKTTENLNTNNINRRITNTASRSVGSSTNVQKVKDDYEKLQQAVQSARREIELAAIAHGTSSNEVQNAFTKYNQLNTQLSSINALFDTQTVKVEQQKGAYQLLNDNVTSLTAKLRDLAAEHKVGTTEWVNVQTQLKETQTELDNVNKSLTDNGVKLEDYGKQISSSISSGLVNALRSGGNAFDAFSSLATTALQKVLDKLIEMSFVTPVLNAFTGGTGGTLFSGIAKIFGSANGNVFQNGNVIPFAKGGVVNQPTIFPMANGGTGLMGEAGAEAVMPLRRMSNGRLGVEAENENGKAVQVNIYNQSGANVETRKRDDGSMDIFIRKVNEALSSERTSSGFRSAYAREDRKGVQAV